MEEVGGKLRTLIDFVSQALHPTAVTLVVHVLSSLFASHHFLNWILVNAFSVVEVGHAVSADWVLAIRGL